MSSDDAGESKMTEYEIPLHGFDDSDEKSGVYVLIEGRKVSLIDYSTETPHDLVSLDRSEAFRLVRVLTTWLASETKLHSLFKNEYGDYRDDDEQ